MIVTEVSMRDAKQIFYTLEGVSERVRRLYAIACFDFMSKYAKINECDMAVKMALHAVDDDDFAEMLKHVRERLKLLASDNYKVELVIELAAICVATQVSQAQLSSIIWGYRGFYKDVEEESKIMDCLDLTGPGATRRFDVPVVMPTYLTLVAESVYYGDRAAVGILADAAEDARCPRDWVEHLTRPGRHWKGCWVVDNILRRS